MTYEEYLDENGELTYTNVGTSMMPLLKQHRDLFTVTKRGSERLKKGDVVLYRRPPKRYVLHRIVEVRPADYVILGDNCVKKEYGIKDDDILAVMTGYVRKGRKHKTTDFSYRLYSSYIMHTIPLRTSVKRLYFGVRKLAKRVINGKK